MHNDSQSCICDVCRGSFDAKFSTEEISIFETLGNGFSKLCEIWLKEKHDKCWGVAFLCSKPCNTTGS